MEHIVVVDIDGTIYGMWSDDLLGIYEVEHSRVEVERASHVEFCATCVAWHVWERSTETFNCAVDSADLMVEASFTTRKEALAWEVEEINRRLLKG